MPSNFKVLSGASGEPNDPNFKNVTLLLHGDGSNGAQNNTFLDSSTNNFTITRNGNTTQGSFSPYGSNWSNYFDGSGDYLTVASDAAFGFGTGAFTIEGWVFVTGSTASGSVIADFRTGTGTAIKPCIYFDSAYTLYYLVNGSNVINGGTIPTNSWVHVALARSGTSTKMFVNGVQVGSTYSDSNDYGASASCFIGADNDGGANAFLVGYASNVRVVKGTAVYTAAFTPPTAPLTAITNTSLLTCAYNRFRDGSTNNFTITRNGDVKVTNFAPFAPSAAYSTTTNGGSAYFDGTGDYLQTPSNTAFTFSGSLTIEFWINFSSTPSTYVALVAGTTANTQLFITTKIDGTGLRFGLSGVAEYATGSQTWAAGAWYHVALVRNGTDVRFYVNGVNVTDGTATNSTSYSGAFLLGGNVGGTVNFPGYISNLRVVKDTAVYTAAFTPPTAPVTAITNTSLLLNTTNAAIFDNSMKNDLETVGNAQISTSVKKFGTGSMAFDGSGDYLTSPIKAELGYSTGDFTIEFWVYPNNSTGAQVIFDQRAGSASGTAPTIYLNSGSLRYYTDGADRITGGSVSAAQWSHIAVCRSGTSTKMFINGTQTGSTLTDTRSYVDSPISIGEASDGTGGAVLNGYIDDFRITKGVARYTANFTAPTAPFPNK